MKKVLLVTSMILFPLILQAMDDDFVAQEHSVQGYGSTIIAALDSNNKGKVVLFKYDTDGHVDNSFGVAGRITFNVEAVPAAITVQQDGKIIVVTSNNTDTIFLNRFLADGSIDETFGIAGRVSVNQQNFMPTGIVVQHNGNIFVSGTVFEDALVLCFDNIGMLNPIFGVGGQMRFTLNNMRSPVVTFH